MSEFIDREKAIANIKAAYCCGCENYNGVRCRACQIMDAMDVLEDEPAVVPDVQRWRKTAEEPQTEKDSVHGNVLVKYMDATFAQSATWDTVASAPDLFTLWMPMPKLPDERPQKLYWREIACTTICPVCGYECNDDYYLDKFCPGCGTRLWFNDSCPRYAEYKRQLKAQRIYTNGNHAAERISRNDFDKEGWMGGRKR